MLIITACLAMYSCNRAKVTKEEHGITVRVGKDLVGLTVYDENIIRVRATDSTDFSARKSLVVLDTALKMTPWNLEESGDAVIISTSRIKATVNRKTGRVSFSDLSGNPLLTEAGRAILPNVVNGRKYKKTEQKFLWQGDEALYGLGQFQNGVMNYRGMHLDLYQQNTVVVTPVLVSSKGYGIYWDNYSQTQFADTTGYVAGKPSIGSLASEVADQIDYYFIYGPSIDTVTAGLRDLSGRAPMFGRWAYGLWQCKEHYNTQAEILGVAAEYRKRNIPVDNIVQDWFYWNPEPWGSHYFDRKRYPYPSSMTRVLHDTYHMKIMISVWSKFMEGSPNYEEMKKAGFLFPATQPFGNKEYYYDAYNPAARKLYWKQISDSLYSKGFDAWWLDATEPEIGDLSQDSIKKVMDNYLGSGARYLNTYSLMTTEAVYQGQRSESEKQRVFILTRSNFLGQQRNAAASWSGDISASWDVFRKQIAGGLNLGLAGLPYWTTDIGAFFVNGFPGGNQNKEYQELFVRWFQFGAFCPVFRVHGTSTPREMYQFGENGKPAGPGYWAYDAQLKADKLRYRLMPYIYSMAWKISDDGSTLMRGLIFDFPKDKNVFEINDQYMFGPSILVCPVTAPMYHKDFYNQEGMAEVIPAGNLFSPDGKTKGLKTDYYNDPNLKDHVATSTDPEIDFDWGSGSPENGVNTDRFSVMWTGKLLADETGDYTLITEADDGIRLYVDGKMIIDNWVEQAATYKSADVKLVAGKKYNLKVEYMDLHAGAVARLLWITPSKKSSLKNTKEDFYSQKLKSRKVYLPEAEGWYDFWSGEKLKGGQFIDAPAPVDEIPLFVKAGSIIPLGPVMNYSTEKPCDPVELQIYPGNNASFEFYEDENDNYDYEKGLYSIIPLEWDDASSTLTIGARRGQFPGMMQHHTFNIVLKGKGGIKKQVSYDGNEIRIKME